MGFLSEPSVKQREVVYHHAAVAHYGYMLDAIYLGSAQRRCEEAPMFILAKQAGVTSQMK